MLADADISATKPARDAKLAEPTGWRETTQPFQGRNVRTFVHPEAIVTFYPGEANDSGLPSIDVTASDSVLAYLALADLFTHLVARGGK